VLGAILAGGAGGRMGGCKADRPLAGRPLVAYPLDALSASCDRVVVVCKPGEGSRAIGAAELWDDEPAEPRHPATGIAHALERAGAPVLVCAADMPFVTPGDCAALIDARGASPDELAVIAAVGDEAQPTFGIYAPAAADALRTAAMRGDPLRRVAEELNAATVGLPADRMRSVNTEVDLRDAERELVSRGPG
jgi:molybdopterin-guanine dinucleotide biosynthesis protein A